MTYTLSRSTPPKTPKNTFSDVSIEKIGNVFFYLEIHEEDSYCAVYCLQNIYTTKKLKIDFVCVVLQFCFIKQGQREKNGSVKYILILETKNFTVGKPAVQGVTFLLGKLWRSNITTIEPVETKSTTKPRSKNVGRAVRLLRQRTQKRISEKKNKSFTDKVFDERLISFRWTWEKLLSFFF